MRSISNYVRIVRRSVSPLDASHRPSRFSPFVYANATGGENPLIDVIYMASNLATASYETLIRDGFDLEPTRILAPEDYRSRIAVNISTKLGERLTVLDLTNGNASRHGVPSDVVSYSNHTDGRHFASFVHSEFPTVDGLLYESRFTRRYYVAVFDRGIHRLVKVGQYPLNRRLLGPALQNWNFNVI